MDEQRDYSAAVPESDSERQPGSSHHLRNNFFDALHAFPKEVGTAQLFKRC
jgi:hypothetical protein